MYILRNKKKEYSFSLFIKNQFYIGFGFYKCHYSHYRMHILFSHEMAIEFLWPYFRAIQYERSLFI